MTILPIGSTPVSASSGRRISHPAFHGVCREQNLGHEQNAIPEIDSDDAHPLDQGVIQNAFGGPTPLEENPRRLFDLGL